jgi:putative restriction endonuclease
MPDILIANITWNPQGWRNTYINPKAGHSYAKEHPGHESLNFKFDKKGLDTVHYIHGYVQWTNAPTNFNNGGLIIFYSRNTDDNKGQIVGIYGNAEILKTNKQKTWIGFENNILTSNIRADKDLSILFPIPLDSKDYFDGRAVPQVGYTYSSDDLAEKIVNDEIKEINKSGKLQSEIQKLLDIYRFLTGAEYTLSMDADLIEQEELREIYSKTDKQEIINELLKLKSTDPVSIVIKHKSYKRNNKTIAQLKIIRDFKCQICDIKIPIKNRKFYIEAAHIIPKCKKGTELPENILILCPNHHKEFDFSDKRIIEHSKKHLIFEMNYKEYTINLELR